MGQLIYCTYAMVGQLIDCTYNEINVHELNALSFNMRIEAGRGVAWGGHANFILSRTDQGVALATV